MTHHEPNQADLDELHAMQSWLADVPRPADANDTLGPWFDHGDNDYYRTWTIPVANVDVAGQTITVEILGTQHQDGTTERTVTLGGFVPLELSAAEAAALAAALQLAADLTASN